MLCRMCIWTRWPVGSCKIGARRTAQKHKKHQSLGISLYECDIPLLVVSMMHSYIFIFWPAGLMDKASAPGAGNSRFESWADQKLGLGEAHKRRTALTDLCSRMVCPPASKPGLLGSIPGRAGPWPPLRRPPSQSKMGRTHRMAQATRASRLQRFMPMCTSTSARMGHPSHFSTGQKSAQLCASC